MSPEDFTYAPAMELAARGADIHLLEQPALALMREEMDLKLAARIVNRSAFSLGNTTHGGTEKILVGTVVDAYYGRLHHWGKQGIENWSGLGPHSVEALDGFLLRHGFTFMPYWLRDLPCAQAIGDTPVEAGLLTRTDGSSALVLTHGVQDLVTYSDSLLIVSPHQKGVLPAKAATGVTIAVPLPEVAGYRLATRRNPALKQFLD